jgi:dienelactone hydrolase
MLDPGLLESPQVNGELMGAAFLFGFCLCAMGVVSAQTLKVTPSSVMVDEVAVIHASGFDPNEHISFKAELVDGAGEAWASQAEFVADAMGNVDLSKQAPVKGSYSEVSAMGLVWSMMPTGKHAAAYRPLRGGDAQIIRFSVLRKDQLVAHAQLEQRFLVDGVRQIRVEGELEGVLLLPSAAGPHPGVLVVGGSEGGVPFAKAAWLASHGYAALALAYFHHENLPARLEAIPLEYFGRALAWMMQRPEIAPDRLAVVGTSRGGELALQLGSMYPDLKAVIAYVPSDVRNPACCGDTHVPYAWTWKSQPLSYLPLRSRGNPQAEMLAAIAVEQTHGAILLVSGEDDGVWPSSMMCNSIVARLRSNHFSYPVEHLKYAHAGHSAGRPEIVPAWHGVMKHPISGREEDLGGNAKGDAQSSLDAIPKVLAFLQQNLQKPATEPAK